MTRSEQREEILILTFEKTFHEDPIENVISLAKELRPEKINQYIENEVVGILDNVQTIDELIEQNSIGWKLNRIPRITLCIMRLAVYEMMYDETVPVKVAINESLELCKKYASDEDRKFVNGVLGAISKKI